MFTLLERSLLETSLLASALVLLLLALRALAGRRLPRWAFVALWAVAALRFLVPYSVPLPILPPAEPALLVTAPQFAAPPPLTAVAVNPLPVVTQVPAPDTAVPWPTLLYGCVAALLALFFLAAHLRARLRYRNAEAFTGVPLPRTWRRVSLRVSGAVKTPLTYGLLRPVILLPETMNRADEARLRCVLLHEFIHVRRCDALLKALFVAALCVHWFNPLAWLMVFLAARDLEISCDEAVLSALGSIAKRPYAHALLDMAAARAVSPLASGFGKKPIEERIRSIMTYKKNSALAVLLALVMVVSVTTAFATTVTAAKSPAPKAPNQADALPPTDWTREKAGAIMSMCLDDPDSILSALVPFGVGPDAYGFPCYDGKPLLGVLDPKEVIFSCFLQWDDAENRATVPTLGGDYPDGVFLRLLYEGDALTGVEPIAREEMETADGALPGLALEEQAYTVEREYNALKTANDTLSAEAGNAIATPAPLTPSWTRENAAKGLDWAGLGLDALKPFGVEADEYGYPTYDGKPLYATLDPKEGTRSYFIQWNEAENREMLPGDDYSGGVYLKILYAGDTITGVEQVTEEAFETAFDKPMTPEEKTAKAAREEAVQAMRAQCEALGLVSNGYNGKIINGFYDERTGDAWSVSYPEGGGGDTLTFLTTVYAGDTVVGFEEITEEAFTAILDAKRAASRGADAAPEGGASGKEADWAGTPVDALTPFGVTLDEDGYPTYDGKPLYGTLHAENGSYSFIAQWNEAENNATITRDDYSDGVFLKLLYAGDTLTGVEPIAQEEMLAATDPLSGMTPEEKELYALQEANETLLREARHEAYAALGYEGGYYDGRFVGGFYDEPAQELLRATGPESAASGGPPLYITAVYAGDTLTGFAEITEEAFLEIWEARRDAAQTGASTDGANGAASKYRPLTLGMTGDDVSALQNRLIALGYYEGAATGKFDEKTEQAVLAFQTKNGLWPDGTAGDDTQSLLYSAPAVGTGEQKGGGAPAASPYRLLAPTMKGNDVVAMQNRLAYLGYYEGTPTGEYDKETEQAVAAFKSANGMQLDYAMSTDRQKILYSNQAVASDAQALPDGDQAPSYDPVFGMEGESVRLMQQRLAKLSFYQGKPSGKFDEKTRSALIAFQSFNGLFPDGTVGSDTRTLLESGQALPYRLLRSGVTGEDVRILQKRLSDLGFYEGGFTGEFDERTGTALSLFQFANNLDRTEMADLETQLKLHSSSARMGPLLNKK